MPEFRYECTIPVGAHAYWLVRESVEYMAFQCAELGLRSVEEMARWVDDAGVMHYTIKTVPDMNVPRILRGILGGKPLEFVDTHSRAASFGPDGPFESTFTTTPPVYPDKIEVRGRVWLEPIDGDHCRQVIEGRCDVNVFGGSLIQKIIMSNLDKSYKTLPELVSKFRRSMEDRGRDISRVAAVAGTPSRPSVSPKETVPSDGDDTRAQEEEDDDENDLQHSDSDNDNNENGAGGKKSLAKPFSTPPPAAVPATAVVGRRGSSRRRRGLERGEIDDTALLEKGGDSGEEEMRRNANKKNAGGAKTATATPPGSRRVGTPSRFGSGSMAASPTMPRCASPAAHDDTLTCDSFHSAVGGAVPWLLEDDLGEGDLDGLDTLIVGGTGTGNGVGVSVVSGGGVSGGGGGDSDHMTPVLGLLHRPSEGNLLSIRLRTGSLSSDDTPTLATAVGDVSVLDDTPGTEAFGTPGSNTPRGSRARPGSPMHQHPVGGGHRRRCSQSLRVRHARNSSRVIVDVQAPGSPLRAGHRSSEPLPASGGGERNYFRLEEVGSGGGGTNASAAATTQKIDDEQIATSTSTTTSTQQVGSIGARPPPKAPWWRRLVFCCPAKQPPRSRTVHQRKRNVMSTAMI